MLSSSSSAIKLPPSPIVQLYVLISLSSDLSAMTFYETKIKNIELDDVNFSESEISNTNLNNIDFSTCNISNIMIDNISLRGMIIDRFQAFDIVHLLGVKFKE